MTLRTLNYGNYGMFLIMGNAGFCPSAVAAHVGNPAAITYVRLRPVLFEAVLLP